MKLYVSYLGEILIVQNAEVEVDMYDEHEFLMLLNDHQTSFVHLYCWYYCYYLDQLNDTNKWLNNVYK